MAADNTYRTFRDIWTCDSCDICEPTDRHTDTDTLLAILLTLSGTM